MRDSSAASSGLKIAVASGKGGTGKTTVAVNLAAVASQAGARVHLLDCDVEEPNCHIFVKPRIESAETVTVPVPEVDDSKCTHCGKCSAICQFHAIACLKDSVLVFPELCHGCAGCWLVCPEGAICEASREVGVLEQGSGDGFRFTQGRLRVGEAMSPPLIRKVKAAIRDSEFAIVDCPPGTSCPVVAAVKGSDFVLLVTEPTPFGLNDLGLAVETVRQLGIPMGVVINRADIGDDRVHVYCRREGIAVLAEIPDDRRIAEAYSRGGAVLDVAPEHRERFRRLHASIFERCGVCNHAAGDRKGGSS